MEKTRAKLKVDVAQSDLRKGDEGYIDGYCRGGNDVPYAAFVSGETVDLVPLHSLRITTNTK